MKSVMITILCAFALVAGAQSLSKRVPQVYSVENTGAKFEAPEMPAFNELKECRELPDPLEWSNGKGKVKTFDEWSHRRSEIAHEIQHYGIGTKPAVPDGGVMARMVGDTLFLVSQIVSAIQYREAMGTVSCLRASSLRCRLS